MGKLPHPAPSRRAGALRRFLSGLRRAKPARGKSASYLENKQRYFEALDCKTAELYSKL